MKDKPRAIIVGAGAGGLATANILAKAGWHVEIFEQKSQPGGRAGLLEMDGFRFDTGPSWYLMPEVFEHYFSLLDETVAEHLELIRLDPAYKVFYDYRKPLLISGAPETNLKMFESIEPGAGTALGNYLKSARRVYGLAQRYFLYNTFQSKRSVLQPAVIRHSLALVRLLTTSLNRYVNRSFRNQALRQILQYPAVFLATSPFQAPAMYHLMSHLDFKQGVFYPRGGMYELIEALHVIGKKHGVIYHFNEPVIAITTSAGKATGLKLASGKVITADIVISNADLHYTETQLLPQEAQTYPEKYWQTKTSGPSALLMYLGVKGTLPKLEHHNLLFTESWRENFAQIFDTKEWPAKPALYICRSSATDDSVAPAGHENIFVLVPLPAKTDYEQVELDDYAQKIIDFIAETCDVPDLAHRIVTKRVFGPADFASELHAWNGTALGLGHTLSQSALFRPANRSRKLSNLFYVGGDVQPGVGLPMCLISAELVYKYLIDDRTAGPLTELRAPRGGAWHV